MRKLFCPLRVLSQVVGDTKALATLSEMKLTAAKRLCQASNSDRSIRFKMKALPLILVTLLCIFSVCGNDTTSAPDLTDKNESDRIIETFLGKVKGKLLTSRGGHGYYA